MKNLTGKVVGSIVCVAVVTGGVAISLKDDIKANYKNWKVRHDMQKMSYYV